MKPKCLHRFALTESHTEKGRRISTYSCSLCGKTKISRKKISATRAKINPVSAKRKIEGRQYTILRKLFLEENPRCQVMFDEGCTGKALECHHKAGRAYGFYLDTRYFCATCPHCHQALHHNPAISKERGWILDPLTLHKVNQ